MTHNARRLGLLLFLLSLPLLPPFASAVEVTSSSTINNFSRTLHLSAQSRKPLYIWQGFEHEWLRFVLLRNSGRIPHRLSKFYNFIEQPTEEHENANFHFAQSTGVDGNFMNPKGNYRPLYTDSLISQSGHLALTWSDQLENSDIPVANSKIRETIVVPLGDNIPENREFAMILQGIQLDLDCDNSQQPESDPCNSNGMWPYVFNIALNNCQLSTEDYRCDVDINIYRAWTPNRGGFQLPPIFEEIKPLNHQLDFALNVHFSLISEQQSNVLIQPNTTVAIEHDLHHRQNVISTRNPTPPHSTLNQHVSAITAFGFSLSAPESLASHWSQLQSDTRHQGRYIGKLTNRVVDSVNIQDHQETTIQQSLWAPITVVNATSHVQLDTLSLWFSADTQIGDSAIASGKLCINSTDQAPAFSRWKMCDFQGWLARIIYGGKEQEQTMTQLPIFRHH
ncbi:hypothetical protein A9Q99_11395 [Gammaproteobacteria bacterium 45_16_T64]|nr:hypothetical protein A9Q99_11395 [Gammaproteobacteria bacterium 45_16_T64]